MHFMPHAAEKKIWIPLKKCGLMCLGKNKGTSEKLEWWTPWGTLVKTHPLSKEAPRKLQSHWISLYFSVWEVSKNCNSDQIQCRAELICNQADLPSICLSSNCLKEKGERMPVASWAWTMTVPHFHAIRAEWNQLGILPLLPYKTPHTINKIPYRSESLHKHHSKWATATHCKPAKWKDDLDSWPFSS